MDRKALLGYLEIVGLLAQWVNLALLEIKVPRALQAQLDHLAIQDLLDLLGLWVSKGPQGL